MCGTLPTTTIFIRTKARRRRKKMIRFMCLESPLCSKASEKINPVFCNDRFFLLHHGFFFFY